MIRGQFLFGMAWVVCLTVACPLSADYYDDFNDGAFAQDPNDPCSLDPNVWDIDNPHWWRFTALGDWSITDANDGRLRLAVPPSVFYPYGYHAAYVDYYDKDPNTSTTYFDNSAAHYVLAKVKFNPTSPDTGHMHLLMHGNTDHWEAYASDYEADGDNFMFNWLNGIEYETTQWTHLSNPPDESSGFWVVLQFDPDGPNDDGDPNDPNDHWLQTTLWDGGKFDWNGQWMLQVHILHDDGDWDPNVNTYWTEGICGVATYADDDVSDAKFDGIEVRWGTFTNASHTLSLSVKNAHMGTVTIDPDLLDDPNNIDPNDFLAGIKPTYDDLRRYTDGTEIVLVAEALQGKSFKSWKIYDPNHPGENAYAVEDTNAILYLTMDADWEIEASFKCGSSQVLPPIGMVLLALAAGVAIRRLT